jgi:hypothetical protein
MYQTNFGAFNGRSWEDLCQQIFKSKYATEGYVPLPASPGDYGIEGYTAHTGVAFQCYCPEKICSSAQLYEQQRDKITADLGKLKNNVVELGQRLGTTKIREWNFVSPTIDKHDLLRHAKTKEQEVRGWSLPILANDFTVLVKDVEFFLREIREIQSLNGEHLTFDLTPPQLDALSLDTTDYEANINRKSQLRVGKDGNVEKRKQALAQSTSESFLQSTPYLRGIENTAPTIYFSLLRLFKEFELQVREASATRTGTPEELTIMLRSELEHRISGDLGSKLDGTTAAQLSRQMIARWLAVCQLDFD